MSHLFGYYRVFLECGGFTTPFIVYASSDRHAVIKTLDNASPDFCGASVNSIEGPYWDCTVFE
jgi:hypothetical protein